MGYMGETVDIWVLLYAIITTMKFIRDTKKINDDKTALLKAITQNPANTKALYDLGKIEIEAGMKEKPSEKKADKQAQCYQRAEGYLKQAVGFEPQNPDYLAGLGQAVLVNTTARAKGNRLQYAQELFTRAASIAPKHIASRYYLALLASEQGQWVRAESLCQELLVIAPKDDHAHRMRIGLLERDNRIEASKAEFDRYLALVPADDDSLQHYLKLLGRETPPKNATPAQQAAWRDALQNKTLTLLENNIQAMGAKQVAGGKADFINSTIEQLYVRGAQPERRRAFMARLESRFPTQKNILVSLATLARPDVSAHPVETHKKIIGFYRLILKQYPNDGDVWYALGHEYELLKDKPEAIRAYKEVVRRDKESLSKKAALEALEKLKAPLSQ
jgi:cytochrome c-type biogenesis protein CcmH/NrfG